MRYLIIVFVIFLLAVFGIRYLKNPQFSILSSKTTPINLNESESEEVQGSEKEPSNDILIKNMKTQREILITDGVKHSIPLSEILSGGPGKDGIPSIDNPKFIRADEATFLNDNDTGLGLMVNRESRFYPYQILVWHEIVNDTIAGQPILVTYCPLCATGIVFERKVDGKTEEFGVSGRLWQSNLLMYNRSSTLLGAGAPSEANESLWSQVLGEAVLGTHTGKKLSIIRSDVVRFGDWKSAHSDTKVLSKDTGTARSYGRDPYGNYYTSESVSFGATFSDTRLHPKTLVYGIEIDGRYKAYPDEALKTMTGIFKDTFAEKEITITRTDPGEITFTADGESLSSIPGFWFSWLAVHPETELYQ